MPFAVWDCALGVRLGVVVAPAVPEEIVPEPPVDAVTVVVVVVVVTVVELTVPVPLLPTTAVVCGAGA